MRGIVHPWVSPSVGLSVRASVRPSVLQHGSLSVKSVLKAVCVLARGLGGMLSVGETLFSKMQNFTL